MALEVCCAVCMVESMMQGGRKQSQIVHKIHTTRDGCWFERDVVSYYCTSSKSQFDSERAREPSLDLVPSLAAVFLQCTRKARF